MFPLAKILPVLAAGGALLGLPASAQQSWKKDSTVKLEKELTARYGEAQRPRIERGLKQVAEFWRDSDGDAAVFEDFVRRNFIGDQAGLDTLFARCEKLFEQLDGHMLEIMQAFRLQVDLDLGPIMPYDEIFAAYEISSGLLSFRNLFPFGKHQHPPGFTGTIR